MAAPYILAKTMKDAHAFGRNKLGLTSGRYRVVTSASSISGPRGADLHLVPGWEERHDRFAVRGALRYTRLNIIRHDVEPAEAPEPQSDGLNPPGVQLSIDDASAFFDLPHDIDHPLDEPAPPTPPDLFEAPAPEPVDTLQAIADDPVGVEDAPEVTPHPEATPEPTVKRRRSRCKACGSLHFKDDPCPEAE